MSSASIEPSLAEANKENKLVVPDETETKVLKDTSPDEWEKLAKELADSAGVDLHAMLQTPDT